MEFSDAEEARKILESVSQDNDKWISAHQEGSKILCKASSDTLGGILHTAEDFLSCVVLAEKVISGRR